MVANRYQRSPLSFVFGILTAVIAGATVIVCGAFLVLSYAHAAVMTLAWGCCIMGVMRALWPGHPWFGSRNRAADVVLYLAIGIVLMVLAPAVNVMPPR